MRSKFVAGFVVFFFFLTIVSPSFAQETEKEETILCSKCGAEHPATAKFCTKCGARLAEQVAPPEPEEKIPEPPPPIFPPEEPFVEPAPEEEIPPVIQEEAVSVSPDEIRAEALYNHATALFAEGLYTAAAASFSKVVRNYPSTKYAEAASLMLEACYRMAAAEKGQERKGGSKDAFTQGFLGGCLGVAAAIALLVLLISGLD